MKTATGQILDLKRLHHALVEPLAKKSLLSRIFFGESLSRTQKKRNWLRNDFEVAVRPEGTKGDILIHPKMLYIVKNVGAGEGVVIPFETTASNEDDGYEELVDLIGILSRYEMLNLYVPKPGQTESDIPLDQPLPFIFHDDPEHDHQSTRLIDFVDILAIPEHEILRTDLNDRHYHLLIR